MIALLALITLFTALIAVFAWRLSTQFGDVSKRFFLDVAALDEADTVRHVTVTDALLRIEEAATAAHETAREAGLLLSSRIAVATELGYQNAEAGARMEKADAHVASDLAGSIARADALPQDGNFGAAADAALRSPEPEPEPEPEPAEG